MRNWQKRLLGLSLSVLLWGMASCNCSMSQYLTALPVSSENTIPIPSFSPTPSPVIIPETSEPLPFITQTPAFQSFPIQPLSQMLEDGADWHVWVKELGGRVLFEWRSDEVIHPASIVKVPLGMLVLETLEKGTEEPLDLVLDKGPTGAGRSYRQLLRAMLVYSEEDATEILERDLFERVHQKAVQQILDRWQAPSIRFRPRRASIHDLSTLWECLYTRQCLSESASEQILTWLAEETSSDNGRLWTLKPYLPEESRIYNKRGSMTIPLTVGDCGLVEIPYYPVLLICIVGQSQGEPNFDRLHQKIGEFVQEVWVLWQDYREIKDE